MDERTDRFSSAVLAMALLGIFIFSLMQWPATQVTGQQHTVNDLTYAEPEIDIELSINQLSLKSLPEEYIANVEGTVRCKLPSALPSEVALILDLAASCGGLTVKFLNSGFVFMEEEETKDFSIQIWVQEDIPPFETYDLIVWGVWHYTRGAQSGVTEEVVVPVETFPILSMLLYPEFIMMESEKDEWTEQEVELRNLLCVPVLFNLTCNVDPNLLEIVLEPGRSELEPYGEISIRIRVKQLEKGMITETFDIEVTDNLTYTYVNDTCTVIYSTENRDLDGEGIERAIIIALMVVVGSGIIILIVSWIIFKRKFWRKKRLGRSN